MSHEANSTIKIVICLYLIILKKSTGNTYEYLWMPGKSNQMRIRKNNFEKIYENLQTEF